MIKDNSKRTDDTDTDEVLLGEVQVSLISFFLSPVTEQCSLLLPASSLNSRLNSQPSGTVLVSVAYRHKSDVSINASKRQKMCIASN